MLGKSFRKQGIFYKLLTTHLLIAVIVILAFYCVVSFSYRTFMYEKNAENFQEINRQISINVDAFFSQFIKLSETPYYTDDVRYALENGTDASEIPGSTLSAAQDMAIRMFLSEPRMHSLYVTFDKMGISYSRGYNGSYNFSYDISQEIWYSSLYDLPGPAKVLPLHLLCCENPDSELVMSVGRCIVKPFTMEPLGLIVVNIKPASLRSVLEYPMEISGAVTYVVGESGKIAYSTSEDEINITLAELGLELDENKESQNMTFRGEEVLVVSEQTENTGLQIVSIVPMHDLNRQINQIVNACFYIGVLLLAFTAMIAYGISRSITEPIRNLTSEMFAFESDGTHTKLPRKNADEIEYLYAVFRDMVDRIEDLIQKVIEEGEQKQRAEILALQSQINPHFMYNSLNTIKLMAEIQGDVGISKAISTFAELLRYCAQSPAPEVTTEEEIRFVDKYVELMRLRYFNRFSYEAKVDEDVLEFRMLKFVLQPFLENAIFHGFSEEDRNDYHILLRAWTDERYLNFCIEDNGGGIRNAEILSNINAKKTEEMTSIGIANVISRIQHHYGEDYGVHVESDGSGTKISIRLPKIK